MLDDLLFVIGLVILAWMGLYIWIFGWPLRSKGRDQC
jgi:hypothetical protein